MFKAIAELQTLALSLEHLPTGYSLEIPRLFHPFLVADLVTIVSFMNETIM